MSLASVKVVGGAGSTEVALLRATGVPRRAMGGSASLATRRVPTGSHGRQTHQPSSQLARRQSNDSNVNLFARNTNSASHIQLRSVGPVSEKRRLADTFWRLSPRCQHHMRHLEGERQGLKEAEL